MANLQKYDDSATIVSIFTTELNSLANNASVRSNAIDPAGELFCDIELAVKYTSSTPVSSTAVARIYFLPSVDGVNYPEGSTTVIPESSMQVAELHSRNASTSTVERLVAQKISLPARTYKVLIQNRSGFAFAATGNTLKIKPYKINMNG